MVSPRVDCPDTPRATDGSPRRSGKTCSCRAPHAVVTPRIVPCSVPGRDGLSDRMEFSADPLPRGEQLAAQVVIVGAGPAGIVTALEVADQGIDVLLIESGQWKPPSQLDNRFEPELTGPARHAVVPNAVRRQVGGTSVIWGGRCVPFDRVDFDRRPFVENSRVADLVRRRQRLSRACLRVPRLRDAGVRCAGAAGAGASGCSRRSSSTARCGHPTSNDGAFRRTSARSTGSASSAITGSGW